MTANPNRQGDTLRGVAPRARDVKSPLRYDRPGGIPNLPPFGRAGWVIPLPPAASHLLPPASPAGRGAGRDLHPASNERPRQNR